MKDITSMSEAVRVLLDKYPIDYEFGLWDLKRDLFKLYPPSKHFHADTVSRRLREARHRKGYDIICIDPNRSRYLKAGKKSPYQKLKNRNSRPRR